jgi:hypothetical protein
VSSARVLASSGALIVGALLAPVALAQDATPPSIFLRQMTQPVESPLPGSITRDDLRAAPAPPHTDRLRDAVRFDVGVVGDPRCLPGGEWASPGSIPGRRRSRSR